MSSLPPALNQILVYCRPGFEPEAGAELYEQILGLGIEGRVTMQPNTGFALWKPLKQSELSAAMRGLRMDRLIFARTAMSSSDPLTALPDRDRLTPVLAHWKALGLRVNDVWLETPDTNDGKELSGFCKRFGEKLHEAGKAEGLLDESNERLGRLHLFFTSMQEVRFGMTLPGKRSEWPMGIPRLRMPHEAPSRSTLKLAEAFETLMSESERRDHLRASMRAVDLGAAPGGWTWQLVNRGLRVTAIDNGPMKGCMADDSLVEHLRVDGFKYRPRKPVDWLVCDMVEKPARIAQLVADWIAGGDARQAIFNLKLPMKRRFDEVQRCVGIIEDRFRANNQRFELRLKQLYHDREEVTGYLRRL